MARQAKPTGDDGRNRPERKTVKSPSYLQSKTIGTSLSYPLKILNVSDSGMKLLWDNEHQLPFMENTLIELSLPIKLRKDMPEYEMNYLAKVVRMTDGDNDQQVFGVKLIFLEPQSHQMWKEAVSYLH